MKFFLLEHTDENGVKTYARGGERYDGGNYNTSKNGKAWTTKGALKNHLNLYGNLKYYNKYGFIVLVIDTETGMSRMSIDEFKTT